MVASKDTEATRVLGECLRDAELGREVRHAGQRACALQLLPARRVEVTGQIVVGLVEECHEVGIGLQLCETGGWN